MNSVVRNFHKVRIIRNGGFVGLYRPVTLLLGCRQWRLWRAMNSESYSRASVIGEKDGEPFCNESYRIPASIRLTRANLTALDGMLGKGKREVERLIAAFANGKDKAE